MELNDNDLIQIEGYYNKNLSETDRHTFETRVATDKDFAQTVLDYRKMATALDLIKHRQDLAFLRDVDSQMPPIAPLPKPTFFKKWGWMTAAATLLLGVLGLWQLRNTDKSLSREVAVVFEPVSPLGINMGDNAQQMRLEASLAYLQKDYKQAIPLLDKAFALEKDSFLLLYKANALIATGESVKALPDLEALQTSSIPLLPVQWYLALAYIETGQKEKALLLLQKIADSKGEYQAKALTLMGKIK